MSYYVNPHHHQCPGHAYTQLLGPTNTGYCEEILCSWIAQPAYAYSSLAFLLAGLALYLCDWRVKNKMLLAFPISLTLLAIFGFARFALENHLAQLLSFGAMAAFLLWGFALNLSRLKMLSQRKLYWSHLGVTLALVGIAHLLWHYYLPFQYLFVGVFGALFWSEKMAKDNQYQNLSSDGLTAQTQTAYNSYIAGLALLALAAASSFLDRSGLLCDPTNHWLQGQALANVLAAIGLGLIGYHYHQFSFKERPNIDYDVDEIETQLEA